MKIIQILCLFISVQLFATCSCQNSDISSSIVSSDSSSNNQYATIDSLHVVVAPIPVKTYQRIQIHFTIDSSAYEATALFDTLYYFTVYTNSPEDTIALYKDIPILGQNIWKCTINNHEPTGVYSLLAMYRSTIVSTSSLYVISDKN